MRNKKPKVLNIYKIDKTRKRPSFLIARFLSKIIIRKPKYRFLGEEFPKDEPIVFLSNHVGKKAPSKLELYWKRDFRMWGTYEMTEGFKSIHHYLVHIYYHQKKHIPLFFSWFIGTIAAMYITPLYRGFTKRCNWTIALLVLVASRRGSGVSRKRLLPDQNRQCSE